MERRVFLLLFFLLPSGLIGQNLSGLKFCIDPGHGGYESDDRHVIPDPGIDFWESESNFYKALHLKALLEAHGAIIILTRTGNSDPVNDDPSLMARWQLANANNVDWFHSIHSNATGGNNTSVNRTLVLLKEDISTRQPVFPQAVTMSSYIYNHIRAHLGTQPSVGNIAGYPGVYLDYTFYGGPNGGFNLGVLNGLTMPGELSEGSFHDFFPETRRLMNNHYRKMEAHGLVKAFMQYFSVPPDPVGIVAGIQVDNITGKPKNQTVVRLLPENRLYFGDSFNNGFYMFDSLTPGSHKLVFETPRYDKDSVDINITSGSILFVDRTLTYASFPFVTGTTPSEGDTGVLVQSPITIRFSTPMDSALVRQALSFSPLVNGALAWTSDLKNLSFTPSPPLEYLTRYRVNIDSSARSTKGYNMDIDGDGAGGDSYSFTLRTEPALIAQSVSFGQVKKDDTSSVSLKIHNRASYDIIIGNVSHATSQFWTSIVLPDTIRGNDSLAIAVFFNPESFGSFSDMLVVSPDSGAIRVPLSGSSPSPNLLPSHTFIGFGTVPLNASKNWPVFYLRTSSINGVRVDSVYAKTPAFQFSLQSFPIMIELGDTVNATITFFPQILGSQWDTLIFVTNSPLSSVKVTLTGNGSAPVGVELISEVVHRFDLLQNFPNPFNPLTRIEFHIAETSPVSLQIVDMLGRNVRALIAGAYDPGSYVAEWDGTNDDGQDVASGVYFYRLSAGGYLSTRRMVLLR